MTLPTPDAIREALALASVREEGRWQSCDYGRHRVYEQIVRAIADLPEPPEEHSHYASEQGQACLTRYVCNDPTCTIFKYARIWAACRAAVGKE